MQMLMMEAKRQLLIPPKNIIEEEKYIKNKEDTRLKVEELIRQEELQNKTIENARLFAITEENIRFQTIAEEKIIEEARIDGTIEISFSGLIIAQFEIVVRIFFSLIITQIIFNGFQNLIDSYLF